MWLLAVSLAGAHVPHNTVASVAVDWSGELPWVALHGYNGVTIALESHDHGRSWTAMSIAGTADPVTIATYTRAGTLVLSGGAARYAYSDFGDGGDRAAWSSVALDFVPTEMIAADDGFLLLGADGVYAAQPGDAPTRVLTARGLYGLAGGAGGVTVLSDTTLYTEVGGAWTSQALAESSAFATAAVATRAGWYVGAADGTVRFRAAQEAATWTDCAPTPWTGDAQQEILRIVSDDDDGVWIAGATHGPARSVDGCASWEDRSSPLTVDYDSFGGATGTDEAVTALFTDGEAVVHAGWGGYAYTEDGGASWIDPVIIPPDFIRGVAISPYFREDGIAAFGTYAGGVALATDFGAAWTTRSEGLPIQDVQAVRWVSGSDDMLALVNHAPWLWRAATGSWAELRVPLSSAGAVAGKERTFWVAGPADEGGLLRSVDAGRSWEVAGGLEAAGFSGQIEELLDVPGYAICARSTRALACTADAESWTVEWTSAGTLYDAASFQGGWLTSDDAIGVAIDGVSVRAAGDDPVLRLAAPDDQTTLLAATRSGALLRSRDAGTTWEDLGLRVPGGVSGMVAVPDYAALEQVLIASYDGVFVLQGSVLSRFGGAQFVDDASEWVRSEGTAPVDAVEAAFGEWTPLGPGATATVWLRGSTVRLRGTIDARSAGVLRIDGAQDVPFSGADEAVNDGVLVEVTGLDDGWHEVVAEGVVGDGLFVDGFESSGERVVLEHGDAVVTPTTGRCGCRGGAAGVWGGLALFAFGRRKRR